MTCEIWEGDCRDLIPKIDEEINCVITDPPYGVNFRSRRAVTPQGKKFVRDVNNDADLDGAVDLFVETCELLLPKTSAECDMYVFTRWDIVDTWIRLLRDEIGPRHGFAYKMLLVWDKGIPGMGDIDANWGCGHELILYLKKGKRDVAYRRSGIISVDKVHSTAHIHPTEKPVALLERLVGMSTDTNDLVVDPFAGSGSTVVAAQRLNRRSIGMENDPEYVPKARRRLEYVLLA